MSQNLISIALSNEDLAALDAALTTVEEKLAGLIELSVEQRRNLSKMGDKSEAFCRQALVLLAENRQLLPPGLDLGEAENDLRSLDQLRPRFARLRRLVANADDTEMALGSDILGFALDGYAVAKVIGKGAALATMKEAMSARYTRRRSEPPKP